MDPDLHRQADGPGSLLAVAFVIQLSDAQWTLVEDLFDPPGRRGAPARIPRRQMVDSMLFLARTGCQWRYLPARYGPWGVVWQQWLRWRANGVWERAMSRLIACLGNSRAAASFPPRRDRACARGHL